VELKNQEWASYLDSMDHLDYDIARSSWVGDYPDPNTFLDCFVTGRGNNRTGWGNAEYDRLMAEANRQLDPAARFSLFQKAETILVREGVPIAPIYFFSGIMFYDGKRLGGVAGTLVDDHPIRTMYWKDKTKEARP
jgi:oligopeptide transport system substrate-binding protein